MYLSKAQARPSEISLEVPVHRHLPHYNRYRKPQSRQSHRAPLLWRPYEFFMASVSLIVVSTLLGAAFIHS